MNLLHQVEYFQGAAVGRVELVLLGQRISDRLLKSQILRSLIVEPDGVEIVRVFQITHGSEGDKADTVDIVITRLHFGSQYADDLEAETVNANSFVQRAAP